LLHHQLLDRGTAARRSRRWRSDPAQGGQSLVEFALVWPIFVVTLMAIVEFGFAFHSMLSINYASRNAALLGAEAGEAAGADCIILESVEDDVTAPLDPQRITSVEIFRSDQNGAQMGSSVNRWTRTGSTTCNLTGAVSITVPYSRQSNGYREGSPPVGDRCDVLAGCGVGHAGLDTIGVRIGYDHAWVTPLAGATGLLGGGTMAGSGWTFEKANAMRMEPIE
jgi:Flp pilus assembly protein TadG